MTIALVVVLVLVLGPVWLHLYGWYCSRTSPSGQVVIVPGCRVYPNGELSPAFERRVERAVDLMDLISAKQLLFSGGDTGTGHVEAEVGARYAVSLGVPRDILLVERTAKNTRQNACYSADILGEESVVIVSDAYHALRCRLTFGRYFDAMTIAPVGVRTLNFKAGYREMGALAKMWSGV